MRLAKGVACFLLIRVDVLVFVCDFVFSRIGVVIAFGKSIFHCKYD